MGGGGGTILPNEIQHLLDSNIAKIYSPEDGRELGLTGMVSDAMKRASDNDLLNPKRFESLKKPIFADEHSAVSKLLTLAENYTKCRI